MQPDLDLMRAMILVVADAPGGILLSRNIRRVFDGYTDAEVAFNWDLASFLPIVATTWTTDASDTGARILRIRDDARHLVGLFRDDSRWESTRYLPGDDVRAGERLWNALAILLRTPPAAGALTPAGHDDDPLESRRWRSRRFLD